MANKQQQYRIITKLSERNLCSFRTSSDLTQVQTVPVISYLHARPTGFHNLPVKYLVKLFKYLSKYDLQKNAMGVCSHWRYAASRPELWKRMRISRNEIPKEYIMRRLRTYTDIEHLHLENQTGLKDILSQACRCLKKLKHLKLRKCSQLRNSSLDYIIKTHENLESIDLSNTSVENPYMFSKFGYFKKLRSLNLSHVPELTIENLMKAVINCHFLEELKISNIKAPNVHLTDDDADFMVSKISGTLKSLSIDCHSLTNIFLNTLFECGKLTRLCLYGAKNMTGDVLQDLWYYLPKLKEFKLKNAHHITSFDIEQLFSKCARNRSVQQLTLLDLTGCWKLTDNAIEVIAKNCPKLKSITLKSCKILTDLSKLCASLTNLTYLNVAFCLQLNCSSEEISLPPNLKEFVIHLNEKTANLVDKTLESRPDIRIYISQSEFNKLLIEYYK